MIISKCIVKLQCEFVCIYYRIFCLMLNAYIYGMVEIEKRKNPNGIIRKNVFSSINSHITNITHTIILYLYKYSVHYLSNSFVVFIFFSSFVFLYPSIWWFSRVATLLLNDFAIWTKDMYPFLHIKSWWNAF